MMMSVFRNERTMPVVAIANEYQILFLCVCVFIFVASIWISSVFICELFYAMCVRTNDLGHWIFSHQLNI